MPDDQPSRKNSILVREDTNSSRGQVTAHPHFVESVTPFRSPSVTLLDSQQIANQHMEQQLQQQQLQQKLNQYQTQQFQDAPSSKPQFVEPKTSAKVTEQTHPQATPFAPIEPLSNLNLNNNSRSASHSEQLHISSFGMPGAAATNAWLSKPATNIESEPVVSGRATSKQPSDPRIVMDDGKIHILIGVTGSLYVSSVKQIILKLQSIFGSRVAIQVIVTPVAEKMISNTSKHTSANGVGATNSTGATPPTAAPGSSATPSGITPSVPFAPSTPAAAPGSNGTGNSASGNAPSDFRIWHDADEWDTWHGRNDPVIHIELRRWADILLIAPLSANTLGKIAMGLCDNLLTNVVRAWNSQYPILIAPAMVAYAYNHPATKQHLRIIQEEMKWIEILRPTEKVAGSTGGIGMGGMMPWNEIVAHVVQKLGGYPDEDDEDDDEDDDETEKKDNEVEEDDDDDDDDNNDILQETIEHDHPSLVSN